MVVAADAESDVLSSIIRGMKKYTAKELLKWVKESQSESRKEWLEVVFKYHANYNSINKEYQVCVERNNPKVCLHPPVRRRLL